MLYVVEDMATDRVMDGWVVGWMGVEVLITSAIGFCLLGSCGETDVVKASGDFKVGLAKVVLAEFAGEGRLR